jgi:hypothetical protein
MEDRLILWNKAVSLSAQAMRNAICYLIVRGSPEETNMASKVLDHPQQRRSLEVDVDQLSQFIEEHFPAEAASVDMSDRGSVVRLATELLNRLWRWEN